MERGTAGKRMDGPGRIPTGIPLSHVNGGRHDRGAPGGRRDRALCPRGIRGPPDLPRAGYRPAELCALRFSCAA